MDDILAIDPYFVFPEDDGPGPSRRPSAKHPSRARFGLMYSENDPDQIADRQDFLGISLGPSKAGVPDEENPVPTVSRYMLESPTSFLPELAARIKGNPFEEDLTRDSVETVLRAELLGKDKDQSKMEDSSPGILAQAKWKPSIDRLHPKAEGHHTVETAFSEAAPTSSVATIYKKLLKDSLRKCLKESPGLPLKESLRLSLLESQKILFPMSLVDFRKRQAQSTEALRREIYKLTRDLRVSAEHQALLWGHLKELSAALRSDSELKRTLEAEGLELEAILSGDYSGDATDEGVAWILEAVASLPVQQSDADDM